MSIIARQSTARTVMVGPILDASGVAVTDGVVADLKISKNGGAPAGLNGSATLTHRHTGHYSLALTTSDLDTVGQAEVVIDDTVNAMPAKVLTVIEEAVYDALFAASATGLLPANLTQVNGAAQTATLDTIKTDTAAILVDTAEIGTAGAGLTNINLPDQTMNITGDITGNLSGSVGSVTGAVGSVTGAVGSVTAGVTLAASAVQAIWDALTSALTTVGSIGKLIVDNLNATVSSRASQTSVDDLPTNAELATALGTADDATLAAIAALNDLDAAGIRSAVGLASANLDTQLGDLPTNSELATALAGADDATLAAIAALNNVSAADVNAEVDTALADIHLDHLLAIAYDPASKPGAADALLNELVESDAGVSRFTANALEQGPGGGSTPTAADIADAVWEEAIADHSGTAGSTAEALNAAGSAGDPWVTALPGAYGAGSAGKIIGDNLNATVSSRASQTSVDDVPTNAELATALASADDAVLAAVAALNDLSAADIRTAVGLASANLDTQLGDLPTNAELATALASADDAVLAAIAALNNLSQANIRTAVGLGSANLDTQLADLPTNAELTAALASADDAVLAAIAALNNLSAAQVNAEVVDALATDTYAEPAAVPAATASLKDKINWLATLARNRVTQTATTQTLRNDANNADVATAAVSDDGTTFVRGEWT